jgi:hypothetical protein
LWGIAEINWEGFSCQVIDRLKMFTPLYILFQLFQANSATLSGAAEETLDADRLIHYRKFRLPDLQAACDCGSWNPLRKAYRKYLKGKAA